MNDNYVRDAIAEVLQEDTRLLKMLPNNKNWYDANDDDEQPRWSIVPLSKFKPANPLPQITIQLGPDTRLGTHLYESIFYIRCYNSSDKTFVDITDILARVRVLLDGTHIDIPGNGTIEIQHESTGIENDDPGFELPFREARFHWQRV